MLSAKLIAGFSGVLSLAALAAGTQAQDDLKDDLKKLQGKWKLVSLTTGDPELDKQGYAKFSLEIKDQRMLWHYERGDTKEWQFKLGPAKVKGDPRQIDFTSEKGKEGPFRRLGAYEVDGSKLTICISMVDPPEERLRPTEFTARPNRGRLLMVLERQ